MQLLKARHSPPENSSQRLSPGRGLLKAVLFVAAGGLGAWVLLLLAYSAIGEFRLNVGELGDGPYVSGFNGDEAGAPRYRWTGNPRLNGNPANGIIDLPVSLRPEAQNRLRLTFRAAAVPDPPQIDVYANGVFVDFSRADPGLFKTVEFVLPPAAISGSDTTRVEIRSRSFRPEGESRWLGVQVAEVRLLTGTGWRRPPGEAVGWSWLYVTTLGLFLLRLAGTDRVGWAAGAGVAGLVPWLLLPRAVPAGLNLWYMPWLLPGVALAASVAAVLAWGSRLAALIYQFLQRLETDPALARRILAGAVLLYCAYALLIVGQMDYIGHADYADNAVAARNIVQGKGYSLDYAAQFYQKYTLPRPADTWPPLQPALIVPFYVVFGPTTWAAKLPNLLLAAALAGAIFYYGARLFNRRTGLAAALLTLLAVVPAFSTAPAFFETIAYPINDLGFTLLAFLAVASLYLAATGPIPTPVPAAAPPALPDEAAPVPASWRQGRWADLLRAERAWLLAGVWSGLLILSKPSGGILLAVAGLWLLWHKFRGDPRPALPWRSLLLWGGVTVLVVTPFLVRNQLQFGFPYHSTESWDAWITKWNPPDERIYDLFRPFTERELPAMRQLLEFGWDTNLRAVNNQFQKFFTHLLEGKLYSLLILGLLWPGLAGLPRRLNALTGLLGFAFGPYLLFFGVLWHYEPRYFLMWIPWIYLFGLYGLSWLYDRITSSNDVPGPATIPPVPAPATPPGLGLWLLTGLLVALVWPGLAALISEGKAYTTPTGTVVAARWIKENTPPEAVIMSRNVWELSFHSERKSVMIPNRAALPEIKKIMREYGARFLQLDHLEQDDRDINRQWGQRPALWPLLDRDTTDEKYRGFKKVYDKGGLLVYEWDGR